MLRCLEKLTTVVQDMLLQIDPSVTVYVQRASDAPEYPMLLVVIEEGVVDDSMPNQIQEDLVVTFRVETQATDGIQAATISQDLWDYLKNHHRVEVGGAVFTFQRTGFATDYSEERDVVLTTVTTTYEEIF